MCLETLDLTFNAVQSERSTRVSSQLDRVQDVVNDERFENVELQMAIWRANRDSVMIAHDLEDGKGRNYSLIGNIHAFTHVMYTWNDDPDHAYT